MSCSSYSRDCDHSSHGALPLELACFLSPCFQTLTTPSLTPALVLPLLRARVISPPPNTPRVGFLCIPLSSPSLRDSVCQWQCVADPLVVCPLSRWPLWLVPCLLLLWLLSLALALLFLQPLGTLGRHFGCHCRVFRTSGICRAHHLLLFSFCATF